MSCMVSSLAPYNKFIHTCKYNLFRTCLITCSLSNRQVDRAISNHKWFVYISTIITIIYIGFTCLFLEATNEHIFIASEYK